MKTLHCFNSLLILLLPLLTRVVCVWSHDSKDKEEQRDEGQVTVRSRSYSRHLFAAKTSTSSNSSSVANITVAYAASCRPPKDHTYLTIGQDLLGIRQYVDSQYVHNLLHPNDGSVSVSVSGGGKVKPMSTFAPAAAMIYTDLEELKGLQHPAEYGSGIEFADGILDSLFPGIPMGLQIGLWLDGSIGCHHVISGAWDHQITNLTNYIYSTSANKVFLRVGYEFDNPEFKYSDDPVTYKKAFQRIVSLIREGLDALSGDPSKVLFVWHSWAAPMEKDLTLDQFYPGDEYVDWVGISVFQQFYPWAVKRGLGSIDDIERVTMFAQERSKPLMIAESTPFGGLDVVTSDMEQYHEVDAWNRWFAKVLDLIDRFDISMWSYINCDWDNLPMWKGVGFGQTELSRNSEVMQKWHSYVINGTPNRKFLMSGSLNSCGHDNEETISSVSTSTPSSSYSNGNNISVNTGDIVKQNNKVRPNGILDNKMHNIQPVGTSSNDNNPPFTTGKQSVNQSRAHSDKATSGKYEKEPNPSELEKESIQHEHFGGKVFVVFIVIAGLVYTAHYQGYRESSFQRGDTPPTFGVPIRGIGRSGYSYISNNDSDSSLYQQASKSDCSSFSGEGSNRPKNTSTATVLHV